MGGGTRGGWLDDWVALGENGESLSTAAVVGTDESEDDDDVEGNESNEV